MTVTIRLVVTRRGQRLKSALFLYKQSTWNDDDFAKHLNPSYSSLKTKKVSFLQKLIAFKTIAFVYIL